mmetsp:Transcript_119665/g.211488  ORF Transcript_119665/g.211488 Transcript_119665/m.211488 type:complete len:221 (-) Transcript_119665:139-801(-)
MRVVAILLALNGALAFNPSSAGGDSLTHASHPAVATRLSPDTRTTQGDVHMLNNEEAAGADSPGLERRTLLQNSAAALALLLPLSSKAVKIPNPEATPKRDDTTQISLFEEMVLQEAADDLKEKEKLVDEKAKPAVKFFIDLMTEISDMDYETVSNESRMNNAVKALSDLKSGKAVDGVKKLLPEYFKQAKSQTAEKLVLAAIAIGEAVEEWSNDYMLKR